MSDKAAGVGKKEDTWLFKLYVLGDNKRSREAIENLNNACKNYLHNNCAIEVIDLEKHPELAQIDQIFATPTLRITVPPVLKSLIGDLAHVEKVFIELDIPIKK